MQLTTHFDLAQLTRSAKAAQLGIDNTPPPEVLPRLQATAELLQRIRDTLGVPVIVTSGYRCRALNTAVGGVTSSDHVLGRAADVIAPAVGTPYEVARALAPLVSVLGIGQLAYERVGGKAWVHVSTTVPARPANRVITVGDTGTLLGVQP